MFGPQRVSLNIQPEQQRSYSESCLPLTMSVAKKFKSLLEPRLKSIPNRWSFDDRILVLLAKNLSVDVKKFYDSNGPSLAEMLNADQIRHLDQDFVKVLGDLLDVSILEGLVNKSALSLAYKTKKKKQPSKTHQQHWSTIVGAESWFAMARWAKQNSTLSPQALDFLHNIAVAVSSNRALTEAQDKSAKQLFREIMSNLFKVNTKPDDCFQKSGAELPIQYFVGNKKSMEVKLTMPAIANIEELRSVQRDIETFKAAEPEAFKAMEELLKKHRKVGYKNICKLLLGESTPEKLKAE